MYALQVAKEKMVNLESTLKSLGANIEEGTPAYDNQLKSLSKQVRFHALGTADTVFCIGSFV